MSDSSTMCSSLLLNQFLLTNKLSGLPESPPSFYFHHIAKTGGTSFERLGGKGRLSEGLRVCRKVPTAAPTGCHFSSNHICKNVRYLAKQSNTTTSDCNFILPGASSGTLKPVITPGGHVSIRGCFNLTCTAVGGVSLLTIVREPASHVRSMYAHCQQLGALGMKKHHYPRVTFGEWLDIHLNKTADASRFCAYNPNDFQAAALSALSRQSNDRETRLQMALISIDHARWVGVTSWYDASLCLLRSVLQDGPACTCSDAEDTVNKTLRVRHGTDSSAIVITDADQRKINQLTRLDSVLYKAAVTKLHHGLDSFNLTCLLAKPPYSSSKRSSTSPAML